VAAYLFDTSALVKYYHIAQEEGLSVLNPESG